MLLSRPSAPWLLLALFLALACDSSETATPDTLAVSPSTLDFGALTTGQTSSVQTIAVRNTGNATLTVTALILNGEGAGGFQLSAPALPFTLRPGLSETVEVVASPVVGGAFAATLTVESSHGTRTVALSGTATDPVSVTYLGNDGIMLAFEDKKVLIDAIHTNESPWVILPTAERTKLLMGQPPYDGIDLILITHNHGDHSNPTAINTVLMNNPGAWVIAPPQAQDGIEPARLLPVNMTIFGSEGVAGANDISLDILLMHHFDQFGNDFSNVQNYVYSVNLGGKNFLHVGDVEYETASFQPFDLANRDIEVIFMPTFNTLISAATRDLINAQVAPAHIVAMHFFDVPNEVPQVQQLFPSATLFTQAPTTITF
ncbi:MAG: choice-of-anchor D domain-containing protein [Rhodothermaceae bacterium]|nr:choice-of-anchor D domain-containing protein [Rhodothermaceae bacterium]